MDRRWFYRFGLVAGLLLLAGWVLAPSVIYFRMPKSQRGNDAAFRAKVPSWLPKRHLALGLDLQGGIQLIMGVEVDKAVMDKASRRADEIKRYAKEKHLAITSIEPDRKKPILHLKLPAGELSKFKSVMMDYYQDMVATGSAGDLTLAFKRKFLDKTRKQAVEQAVKTIRNRVDAWGVTEPQITGNPSTSQVLIQLPGVKNPDRAKDLLGKTAQLEFRIAEDQETGYLNQHFAELKKAGKIPASVSLHTETGRGKGGTAIKAWYLRSEDRQALKKARAAFQKYAPDDTMMAFEKDEIPGKPATYRSYVLSRKAPVTGDSLVDARVEINPQKGNRPYVAVEFDHQGAKIFGDLTTANVHRRMAIVLDDTVNSAPVIDEPITGGRASITLGGLKPYNQVLREANDLVLVLKAGALPAPVRILEERSVGASLGPDLIRRGVTALIIGAIIVLLFTAVYYKVSGLVADFTLVMNVFFLLAMLAAFGATLTLPGLAGIVLTIGMAVDANVIIYERIREEIDVGKTARAAIDSGFAKAFSAILDGNLTTGIAAFVLLQYGTGPIRGFAVTLLAGIVATLFCGVFASRVFMDLVNRGQRETVSI